MLNPRPSDSQLLQAALQHHQDGRFQQAEGLYREILRENPRHADALHLLGVIALQTGHPDVAAGLIRQAIALRPNFPEAYSNLGAALKEIGQFDEAIAACRQAIILQPGNPEPHNNLGHALTLQGRVEESITAYRQALAVKPDYPQAHFNLGNALRGKGQLDEAAAEFRHAIAARPNYAEAHMRLGNVLYDGYQFDDAIAAYRQAVALRPDSSEAYANLANTLTMMGQIDEAIAAYRQAVTLDPSSAAAHSCLIVATQFHPRYDAQALAEEPKRWNCQHAQLLSNLIHPHSNDRDPQRRIRIGYVSPGLRAHAESHFVIPLLEAHDHEQFDVHCYSSVARPDATTARHRSAADVWHDVLGKSDSQVAEQIRGDEIDVLIDLTMHMTNNRLLAFARKPAPVQVTWLAYPGTTGLTAIDYRITDRHLDPPDVETPYYAEKSIRLPGCWVCYDPLSDVPAAAPRGESWRGPVCFGSLNNPCKINEPLLTTWARILKAVADSRLLLLAHSSKQRDEIRQVCERAGIAPSRLEFAGFLPRADYLRLYDRIDIGLDPLPYNGITTTCDALWMGVPVINRVGRTAGGRAGLGILSEVGMPELVARTEEQYVQITSELAADVPRLRALRSTLRDRMEQSPLMDAPRFSRNIESAYRQMWREWCARRLAD